MDLKRIASMGASAFALCCLVVSAASMLYYYDGFITKEDRPTKIHFKPTGVKKHDSDNNSEWLIYYTLIFYGVICLICAVFEIILIARDFIPLNIASLVDAPVFRGLLYVAIGCLAFGTSGDLGFASGIITIIAGAVVLGVGCFAAL